MPLISGRSSGDGGMGRLEELATGIGPEALPEGAECTGSSTAARLVAVTVGGAEVNALRLWA